MSRRTLIALLIVLYVMPQGAHAQPATYSYETGVQGSGYEDMAVGESRDVPCEYSFSPSFYSYYGVEFEDQMFMSEWRSKRSDFPLPAWNWYYAVPMQTVVSNSGKYRWEEAEIQVHCWVHRTLYVLTHHRDHVASLGRLVELCAGDWDDDDREEIHMQAAPENATLSTTCGGAGGGGGDAGGSGGLWRCYTVTTDHYWYHPDTGDIEYRYTETYRYCEQIE